MLAIRERAIMKITAKLSVAGAAAIFGVVIAAGGAFAVGGTTMVADAPGHVLQVTGVGAPSAGQSAASAHLKLQASASAHDQVEKVGRTNALPVDGSINGIDSLSRPGRATSPHKPGSGSTLLDSPVQHGIPATPAVPAIPGGTDNPAIPATPAVPGTPPIHLPHGLSDGK
jgi:hypothetical protein